MQVKIVGVGKCGVRIAYDFFAYTEDFPSSYEIRLGANEGALYQILGRLTKIDANAVRQRVMRFHAKFKALKNDVNGLYRIAENPQYATIDSDVENNEILNKAVLFDDEGRQAIFPGKNHNLNNHKGGCNFHIVSESLVRGWKNIPFDVTSSDGISIYVTSFSIAGGTGGGSAPVICKASRDTMNDKSHCHHIGLGVLPKSDQQYRENETALSMADYEKFNAGRFFASIYGDRFRNDVKSLWLFSNDTLRFLIAEQNEQKALGAVGGEQKLNLSLVNTFIAQSLTVLSNSSSKLTSADTNLDPRELNDILAGRPFLSALSQRHVANADQSIEHQVIAVKQLLLNALSNVKEQDGRLEGLSVPIHESGLRSLQIILNKQCSDPQQFLASIDGYDAGEAPIEFQTTWRLAMLYGQPEKLYSEFKKNCIESACEKFFPNAQKFPFTFRHHGSTEILLLFLVDPFMLPVVSSVYYYANNAWSQSGKNFSAEFDSLIGSAKFDEPAFFDKEEGFPHYIYGDGADDVGQRVKTTPVLAVKGTEITTAFRHLHEIYHRKRPPMDTSSGLGRSKKE